MAAAATLFVASAGRAEEGHLPALEVGVSSGLTFVPFRFDGKTDSKLGLPLGPRLAAHLELGHVVLSADGFLNLMPATGVLSPVSFVGGASLVVGGRTTVPLRQIVATQTRSIGGGWVERTDTYRIDPSRQLPLIYGLHVGARAIHVREAILEKLGVRPQLSRPPATLLAPEVGFGMISGQFEFLLAGALEVRNMVPGLRWVVQGAPGLVGSWPLSVRLEGQHFFGAAESVPLGHALLFGVVLGTSVGVSAP